MIAPVLRTPLRMETAVLTPGNMPTLRVLTDKDLLLTFVGGRTVVEIFSTAATFRMEGGLPALGKVRTRIAQVPRRSPANTPWPEDPKAFLDEAFRDLDYAAGTRLAEAIAAITTMAHARLLDLDRPEGDTDYVHVEVNRKGLTISWMTSTGSSFAQRRIETVEIADTRLDTLAKSLRMPVGDRGSLARMGGFHIPPIPNSAHERLRIRDYDSTAVIDALLDKPKSKPKASRAKP